MTVIFNNFIVPRISLSSRARGWTQIIQPPSLSSLIPTIIPFPRVLLPRQGKWRRWQGGRECEMQVSFELCDPREPDSPRIDSTSRKSTLLLLLLLLLLLFSPTPPPPSSPVSSSASSTRQTLLLIYSLRVYFAIITFSRLAYRCTSSLINGHESCAKKNETWRKLPAACSRMYLRRCTSCFIRCFR